MNDRNGGEAPANGHRLALAAILLVAVATRLWGIGFGLPYVVARPDETEIAGPAVGFLSGDLRPPFFEWPTLFVYTVALCYLGYYAVTRPFGAYKTLAAFAESRRQSVAPFLYISRLLSALMGVLTVWWLHAIGRRLFDDTIAGFAALFLALSFLHVRDSHFGTTDVPMTALVVLTVFIILRWREAGGLTLAAAAGVAGGLAASTKYNGVMVCVPFAVALVQRFALDSTTSRVAALRRAAGSAGAFGGSLALAFFGASPYILIDFQRFMAGVQGVGAHLVQGHGMILGRGWWYYPAVVLPAALGWPLFMAAVAGMIGLLIRRFRDATVLLAFPIAYYLIAGQGYTVFARYIIPVLPFLCLAGAWAVVEAVRALQRNSAPRTRSLTTAAAAIAVVGPTAASTVALDRLLGTTDNRVVVAQALRDTISPSSLLYQSGERYGYVPTVMDGKPIARPARYDEASGFDPGAPDWILLQRSPLAIYSAVPASLEAIVTARYELVRRFPVDPLNPLNDNRSDRLYDQQDAFYLPLSHLRGLARPGPAFELYRKKPGEGKK